MLSSLFVDETKLTIFSGLQAHNPIRHRLDVQPYSIKCQTQLSFASDLTNATQKPYTGKALKRLVFSTHQQPGAVMGNLTKAEQRQLRFWLKYRDNPMTRGSLLLKSIPNYIVIGSSLALMTAIIFLEFNVLVVEVAIGYFLGGLFRDFLYFGQSARTYSIMREVTNWELVERLLENEEALEAEK